MEGDFSLPAIAFPVQARLRAVTALERRLVMSIELLPDSTRGAIAGPPTGPWDAPPREVLASVPGRLFGLLKRPRKTALPPAPSADSIAALRERVLALAASDSLWSTLLSAEHDLTVLVPAPLLLSIVRSATSRYRAGVDVELDPEIVKRIVRPIRVKMLGKAITAGEVRAAIHVDRLRGRLVATGDPSVDLQPPDGLAVTMPLSLAGGLGTARYEFEWDPTAAAWLVCKGFKAEGTLDGMVGRIQHDVEGTLRFRVEDGKVVGRSALRRDRVRLPLDLTPAVVGEGPRRLRAKRIACCAVAPSWIPTRWSRCCAGSGRRACACGCRGGCRASSCRSASAARWSTAPTGSASMCAGSRW